MLFDLPLELREIVWLKLRILRLDDFEDTTLTSFHEVSSIKSACQISFFFILGFVTAELFF